MMLNNTISLLRQVVKIFGRFAEINVVRFMNENPAL